MTNNEMLHIRLTLTDGFEDETFTLPSGETLAVSLGEDDILHIVVSGGDAS